ncbi:MULTISPECIES: hypothetical protein [unclassified Streptomyces]|uniref:hypothetical protein n=1 Tax=unclassified Streptomyces TaxID=2593676 RepID=UPI000823CEC9|nr:MULTISPECIES: hypothetical protein [unclassified Streptomyces]SCK11592.1 hypothetical protein YW7DRAFT_00642 [Streptomyces sp. AmelKG-E11A]
MVGAEDSSPLFQRGLVERAGAWKVPHSREAEGEIVPAGEGGGVFGAFGALAVGKDHLPQRQGGEDDDPGVVAGDGTPIALAATARVPEAWTCGAAAEGAEAAESPGKRSGGPGPSGTDRVNIGRGGGRR